MSLDKARQLALKADYDDALTMYLQLLAENPDDRALFLEHLAVKGQLIDLHNADYNRTTTQFAVEHVDKAMRLVVEHLGHANIMSAKRDIRTLLQDPRYDDPKRLERFGYKIYSQSDEDGMIAEIFNRIGTTNKEFFEFGVENGLECNTHALLHQGWRGAWVEGNDKQIPKIQNTFEMPLQSGQLTAVQSIITMDNINDAVRDLQLPFDLDLLSIDIDFSDYWVFKALEAIRPRVVVIEYNAKFPPPIKHVVAYDSNTYWSGSDYFGCSLQSLCDLAALKGYTLVGCSIIGMNAFFVRSDLCGSLFATPATAELLYQPPRYELHYMGAFAKIGHPTDPKFRTWMNV